MRVRLLSWSLHGSDAAQDARLICTAGRTIPLVTLGQQPVESWSANRTDAEIKADQVTDQKAREERARERQEQFKEIANSFGIQE